MSDDNYEQIEFDDIRVGDELKTIFTGEGVTVTREGKVGDIFDNYLAITAEGAFLANTQTPAGGAIYRKIPSLPEAPGSVIEVLKVQDQEPLEKPTRALLEEGSPPLWSLTGAVELPDGGRSRRLYGREIERFRIIDVPEEAK